MEKKGEGDLHLNVDNLNATVSCCTDRLDYFFMHQAATKRGGMDATWLVIIMTQGSRTSCFPSGLLQNSSTVVAAVSV